MKWHGVSLYSDNKFNFTIPKIYTNNQWKQCKCYIFTEGQWRLVGAAGTQMIELLDSQGKNVTVNNIPFLVREPYNQTKNLLPPGATSLVIIDSGVYTISVDVTWDGGLKSAISYSYKQDGQTEISFGGMSGYMSPAPAAGTTTREFVKTPNAEAPGILTISTTQGLIYSNWQVEKGSIATNYVPYSYSVGSTQLTDSTNAELVDAGANILTY